MKRIKNHQWYAMLGLLLGLLLGCLFNLAHKSDVPAERIAELWKLADVQSCAPWKSLGVKLFWHLARLSPKFATGIVRLLRRVFPGRE